MFWRSKSTQNIIFQGQALKELKKEYSFVDMHVHTKYSHDSRTPVPWLVKRAEQIGIGFAVTDHKRAEGAIEASRQKAVLTIPGIEVASRENKEILFYFYSAKDLQDYYEKYLKNKDYKNTNTKSKISRSIVAVRSPLSMNKLIELARNYACLISIPHPYTYLNRSSYMFFARKNQKYIMNSIDAVEVVNSTCRAYMNNKAKSWAERRGKAFTAGSDAHQLNQLGQSMVACKASTIEEFLDAVKKKRGIIMGEEMKAKTAIKSMLFANHTKRNKWLAE